ncbi:hypothetical protein SEUCBS139899_009402 [Sporothrix eucalyptigena]
MASSCPGTPRLDGEAAVDHPINSTSVATDIPSFADALKPTITPDNLAPARRPHPRPWHRIAVPGAGSKIGLRTVWKRIGGVPRSTEDARYIKGYLELRADGQGPRKNRRTERHVPAWGDVAWTTSLASAADDAEKDLIEARKTITAQSSERVTTVVEEPTDIVEASAEHITKRTKRRMSRRISLMPSLDGGSLLLHEKKTAPPHVFSSPIKKRAVEVASEPVTPATPATPAAPVSTIVAPIAFEPTFSSPIKTLAPISETPSPAKTASPRVVQTSVASPAVVFDRPVAEIEVESPHEARRWESLHNTRRRDTLFAAVERKLPETTSAVRPNRRHSFLPQQTSLVFESTAKKATSNRRHTFQPGALGIFLSSPIESSKSAPVLDNIPSISVFASENTTSTIELSGPDEPTVHDAPAPTQDETVVVDVRTNLDIFGSGPPVQTHHSPSNDRHVSFDLKVHSEKPSKPVSSDGDAKAAEDTRPEASSEAIAADRRVESEDSDKPRNHILNTLNEEDILEVSNDSTPRSLSPEMEIDMDTSGEDSREVTDDMRIVSSRPATELDESLLLPLPETTEAEGEAETETSGNDYGWQSPTSAELGHLRDTLDTPRQPNKPVDLPISPPSPAHIDISMDLLVDENDEAGDDGIAEDSETAEDADDIQEDEDVDEVQDNEAIEDIAEVEDVFAESASNIEDIEDSPSPAPSVEEDNAEYTVTQPFNMFTGTEDDATTTMTMDLDTLAEDQLSSHEDSETEMLRKFVTRVKADKTAKAAAAAEAASARSLAKVQRKRRSGSTGSSASSSGSPMTKKEGGVLASPFNLEPRVPFGKKDHNMSPSPKKKRRAVIFDGSDENRTHDLLSKPLFDDNSPPRPKRRRRKMEADTGGIFNPEFMASKKEEDATADSSEAAPGPRRSKRTRSQTPVKTAASATNSALSLIPVRLPGSLNLNGDDSYGLSASSLSLRRNDEKDLAATTRVNTRKNKGNADPPCVVVARQSHEALRAVREQKSVFDSPLVPQKTSGKDKADGEDGHSKSRKTKKSSKPAKSVRWAEVLARFQTSDGETSDKATSASPETVDSAPEAEPVVFKSILAESTRASSKAAEKKEPVEAVAAPEPEAIVVAAPAVITSATPSATQLNDSEKTSIPRRTTRVSRLQPPTPRKMIASAAAAKTAAAPTPAPAPAEPAPMGLKALPSVSAKRMATRRAKIVGMGMAGNGTPAPKRRTTRTT